MRNLSRIKFTRGREGFGYAERDERGQVVAMLDANGGEVWRMPDYGWEVLGREDPLACSESSQGIGESDHFGSSIESHFFASEESCSRWAQPSRVIHEDGPQPTTTAFECEAQPIPYEPEGTSFFPTRPESVHRDDSPRQSLFWRAAIESGLVDEASLLESWLRLDVAQRIPDDAADRRLARQAVDDGKLTVWQVKRLLRGRSQGYHLDRYLLLDQIGQGGMGQVFLAYDPLHIRKVAIKVLSQGPSRTPQALIRFRREALVGARLGHENLVRVYGDGLSLGVRFLVMEYVEGTDVARMIRDQHHLPPALVAKIGRQVALGLEHAHERGLIHRDVSPSNILVSRDGQAKLADLGLAIDLTDPGQVTSQGVTLGTLDYLSPEQARSSRRVDIRSDIYSLGCTLYHMACGCVPFPATSLPAKLCAHLADEPRPPTEISPGLPAGLEQVILRMMRKDPADRYCDPDQVALALNPFVA
ncbi:serine/threonine-protein kinase [Isosphaeraceae bacterium EP7]